MNYIIITKSHQDAHYDHSNTKSTLDSTGTAKGSYFYLHPGHRNQRRTALVELIQLVNCSGPLYSSVQRRGSLLHSGSNGTAAELIFYLSFFYSETMSLLYRLCETITIGNNGFDGISVIFVDRRDI